MFVLCSSFQHTGGVTKTIESLQQVFEVMTNVVEQSTHNLKFEGSNPAATASTVINLREK